MLPRLRLRPCRERLERRDRHDPEAGAARSELLQAVEAELQSLLAPERAKGYLEEPGRREVDYRYQIMAQLMFWLWVLSVIGMIAWAFDADGRVHKGRLAPALIMIGLFYSGWLLALSRA